MFWTASIPWCNNLNGDDASALRLNAAPTGFGLDFFLGEEVLAERASDDEIRLRASPFGGGGAGLNDSRAQVRPSLIVAAMF